MTVVRRPWSCKRGQHQPDHRSRPDPRAQEGMPADGDHPELDTGGVTLCLTADHRDDRAPQGRPGTGELFFFGVAITGLPWLRFHVADAQAAACTARTSKSAGRP
jgi:hypothetical protein